MLFLENYFKIGNEKKISLSGLTDELLCVYLKKFVNEKNSSILVLANTIYEANRFYQILTKHYQDTLFFPMDDFLNSEAISLSPDLELNRIETLNNLSANGDKKIVVTNLMGYLRYLPTLNIWNDNKINITKGQKIKKDVLFAKLLALGYKNETLVNKTGEMGNRGFILDIYPIGFENPVRIEFWGDEVDSIRLFDADNQLSVSTINEVQINPVTEFLIGDYLSDGERKQKYLPNYLKSITNISGYLNNLTLLYIDYNQIKNANIKLAEEIFNYNITKTANIKYMFDFESLTCDKEIYHLRTDNLLPGINIDREIIFNSKEIMNYNSDIEKLKIDLMTYINLGKTVVICLDDKFQVDSLKQFINLSTIYTSEDNIQNGKINIIVKSISKGFIFNNYIVLTPRELFKNNVINNNYKSSIKYGLKIKDINKLNIGDYVVHYIHGIGIYNGITTLVKNGFKKDYLMVSYKNNGKLYIPVEKIEFLQKYSHHDGVIPKINQLGGSEWQKTKHRVRDRIRDIAAKLLKISAEREALGGYAFPKDDENQHEFEMQFKYEPTSDQLNVTEQIKKEMESKKPMDMLLCGDVGYGKTEVAFRAIFKAINASKQVAYLCPTTILANQHYENAIQRFKDFPIRIELLNRFVTKKKVNEVIKNIADGKTDLVIGTHRLLSNDIKFKDLGLLVVDEEQRFGVTHKEKIKELKQNVDVLTLSATPIPRTLQMAMSGIRKLSLIETPPVNRYPIQTYVLEENDYIIKDAIYKEISRGGQVFILYNRVEDITDKMSFIQRLVPEASITVAHGQMNKSEIEEKMLNFINGDANVLLCTTIIETGIDIPNANTLIVLNADKFGLSQLYQIRGRVGRSNKIAYAYLMYKREKQLSEIATKRLNAIKEFTELGSGFFIAMRDLSLRGAGDILGSEQAGFIDGVGIELYIKMLTEEVDRLNGKTIDEENVDEKPLIDISTHIENNYVLDDDLKIEIHRKINEINSYEKLLLVKKELEDRFGAVSENINLYMYAEWFERLANAVEIIEVNQTKNYVEFVFSLEKSKKIEINDLFLEASKISRMFRVGYNNKKIKIIIDTVKLERHFIYYINELLDKIKNKYN